MSTPPSSVSSPRRPPKTGSILTRPAGAPAPPPPATPPEVPSPEAPSGPPPVSGPGMDKPRAGARRRKAVRWAAAAAVVVAVVGLAVWSWSGRERGVRVERTAITLATVETADFQEFVTVSGTVSPLRTVYLDVEVGGQIASRLAEEGQTVAAGQPIARLSNDQLTLQALSNEAQLQEQISNLGSSRLALDQNDLSLQQQVVELRYQSVRLKREMERNEELLARGAISQRDFEEVRDEYAYTQQRLDLTRRSYAQDSLSRRTRLGEMNRQMQRLNTNLALVQRSRSDLLVRAPIAGQLSALDADVGASKTAGARIGQIDDLSSWKVLAPIDEHYLARVAVGQRGSTTIAGEPYGLTVTKVFPEVSEGVFQVELVLDDGTAVADVLRRGQSLRIRLELGDPESATLVARGGFYSDTGGQWAFVVPTEGAGEAVRRPIRLGRQNPDHYEVLEGLRPGDVVVTSSYRDYVDADRLLFD